MKINNTYIIEAAPGNEFVLDLLALAEKYNVSVKPTKEMVRCVQSKKRVSPDIPYRDEEDKKRFFEMVRGGIIHDLTGYLNDNDLINFTVERPHYEYELTGTVNIFINEETENAD